MKTLIINGSPRKNGETASIISLIKENLDGEIVEFDTYKSNYSPCVDCRFCWKNNGCTLKDGVTELLCDNFDNIIIASPIYFSQITGPVLSFLSRLQYIWVSKTIRKDKGFKLNQRKGGYVLVGGGNGDCEPATKMTKILLNQLGCDVVGGIEFLKTDITHAVEDISFVEQVIEFTKKFC